MRKTSRIFAFGVLSLLLWSNGALALVDISGKEKVVVSSWGELKTAVADAGNAGKVIVLNGDITADVNNPITSVGAEGIIIDGGGHTITGQTGSTDGQFIQLGSDDNPGLIVQNVTLDGFSVVNSGKNSTAYGVVYNDKGASIGTISGNFSNNSASASEDYSQSYGAAINNKGMINNIEGNFSNNTAEGYFAAGGAIYNKGTIDNIKGTFIENSVSEGYNEGGGALYNGGTIKNIEGDFEKNSTANRGGAIYNIGMIGDIEGNFTGNSSTDGGAIFNGQDATIDNINGNFENNSVMNGDGGAIKNSGVIGDISGNFENNLAQAGTYAQGGAIYNFGTSAEIGDIEGDFTGNSVTSTYTSYDNYI